MRLICKRFKETGLLLWNKNLNRRSRKVFSIFHPGNQKIAVILQLENTADPDI